MVDDPSDRLEDFPTKSAQENERARLFTLINELVQWKNTNNEEVLKRAKEEINSSWERCCNDNSSHPDALALPSFFFVPASFISLFFFFFFSPLLFVPDHNGLLQRGDLCLFQLLVLCRGVAYILPSRLQEIHDSAVHCQEGAGAPSSNLSSRHPLKGYPPVKCHGGPLCKERG